jgi:hypothetical protein
MRETLSYEPKTVNPERPTATQDATPPTSEPALLRAPKREPISLSYHSPRCSICNHPDREAIEQGILHWERPAQLARQYDLGHRRAVYRHARAFRLFQQRAARTRRSLEFIMEHAESVTPTADDIIRAVRAHSCLGEDGRWTEPTRRTIVTHEFINRPPDDRPDLDKLVDSIGRPRLDPLTLTKQFLAATSPQLMDTPVEKKSL